MGKKGNKKVEDKLGDAPEQEVHDVAESPAAEAKESKSRGPRGVAEDAKITVLVPGNPKREGSKAHAAFSNYKTDMTVREFADAVGKDATGHLTYDAKHGFISIAGYDPGAIVAAKPKAEPKAKKEKAVAAEPSAEVQAEVQAETME